MRTLVTFEEEPDGEERLQRYPRATWPQTRDSGSMSATTRFSLGSDDIHVWWIDLERLETDAPAILSTDERARAARFKQPGDSARWAAARVGLRQILAGYTGEQPNALRFAYGVYGKPALIGGSPLRFNLTHARERAALAVAWEREVGIDLESIDPGLDVSPLVAVACRQTEATRIDALPLNEQRETFLTCWTLKEAYLKGIGTGLAQDPRTVEIELLGDGSAAVRDSVAGVRRPPWSVRLLEADHNWIAAVAVPGRQPSIRVYRWPVPETDPASV
jgi:4'-phosphopantetheinyl transferase